MRERGGHMGPFDLVSVQDPESVPGHLLDGDGVVGHGASTDTLIVEQYQLISLSKAGDLELPADGIAGYTGDHQNRFTFALDFAVEVGAVPRLSQRASS